jgi:hypothetical protein
MQCANFQIQVGSGIARQSRPQGHDPDAAIHQRDGPPRKFIDVVMTVVVGVIIALVMLIVAGSTFGSF